MGVAERLRQRHATALESLVRHPFFLAAENGTLSATERDRYFINERHFVGSARGIFALLLTKAPNLSSARHLVDILDGLVNEQEPLFDRIYSDLGLEDPETPAPAARDLSLGMTEIARDLPYVAGIAAMSVAEWSYAEVAQRGDWDRTSDPTLRDWFRLHGQETFRNGVRWLEREIDSQWLDQYEAEVDQAFRRAINLEIAFHADPLR